ncbi:hypothetical protein K0M31_004069 [Melipona bicolor]|uniref:Uncharacterized protein n=1 Tax=Melipona bicolor TaxID=60889 RepID=A0AA40FY55_9HYME|nr:hypothetical protein K0M31_004069 [Melipona bicolor]
MARDTVLRDGARRNYDAHGNQRYIALAGNALHCVSIRVTMYIEQHLCVQTSRNSAVEAYAAAFEENSEIYYLSGYFYAIKSRLKDFAELGAVSRRQAEFKYEETGRMQGKAVREKPFK